MGLSIYWLLLVGDSMLFPFNMFIYYSIFLSDSIISIIINLSYGPLFLLLFGC
jgi:hypothetical protein